VETVFADGTVLRTSAARIDTAIFWRRGCWEGVHQWPAIRAERRKPSDVESGPRCS
jgi:hypothetical protein